MGDSLTHYGIKGMHWGVRRFQNKDGTLTAAGKRRARGAVGGQAESMDDAELKAKVSRMNLEKQYNKLSSEQAPTQLETAKKVVDQTTDLVRQTRKMMPDAKAKMKLDDMSDKELRDAINRELLERQYSDLFSRPENVRQGQARVNQILETAGSILAIGGTALNIALAIKKLKEGG